jgi:trehalose 6-phosphate synthase
MPVTLDLSPLPVVEEKSSAVLPKPRQTASRRLVVASNRLPAERGKSSTGGLAVAVQAALEQSGGIWFGWSGHVGDAAPPNIVDSGRLSYATVDLTRQDYEEYYNGYANRVLWPLFHFRAGLVEFRRPDLAGYLRVNRQFAAGLAPLLLPRDLIWVHDYHLMPLAQELRKRGHENQIGFFLHIPCPPPDILLTLPRHGETLGVLSC